MLIVMRFFMLVMMLLPLLFGVLSIMITLVFLAMRFVRGLGMEGNPVGAAQVAVGETNKAPVTCWCWGSRSWV